MDEWIQVRIEDVEVNTENNTIRITVKYIDDSEHHEGLHLFEIDAERMW